MKRIILFIIISMNLSAFEIKDNIGIFDENSKKESRKSSSNDDLIEIRNSLANLIKEHPESLDNRQILKSMLFDYISWGY